MDRRVTFPGTYIFACYIVHELEQSKLFSVDVGEFCGDVGCFNYSCQTLQVDWITRLDGMAEEYDERYQWYSHECPVILLVSDLLST